MLTNFVLAEVFQYVGQEFDWALLSQKEKNERVTNIYKILFPTGEISRYTRKEFKEAKEEYYKKTKEEYEKEAVLEK